MSWILDRPLLFIAAALLSVAMIAAGVGFLAKSGAVNRGPQKPNIGVSRVFTDDGRIITCITAQKANRHQDGVAITCDWGTK